MSTSEKNWTPANPFNSNIQPTIKKIDTRSRQGKLGVYVCRRFKVVSSEVHMVDNRASIILQVIIRAIFHFSQDIPKQTTHEENLRVILAITSNQSH